MKQIQNIFLIMIIAVQCITFNLQSMQQLKKNLQDLNVSLKVLENKIQQTQQLSAFTPPPSPSYQPKNIEKPGEMPDFIISKIGAFAPHRGGGFAQYIIGLIQGGKINTQPLYNLILYGPRFKFSNKEEFETEVNKITSSLLNATGEDDIVYYPTQKANANIEYTDTNETTVNRYSKVPLVFIDARDIEADYKYNQEIWDLIKQEWQNYNKGFKTIEQSPHLSFPTKAIYATNESIDVKFVDQIVKLSNEIFDHITTKDPYGKLILTPPYQDITSLKLINHLIKNINNFKNLIIRFQTELQSYMSKLAPQGTTQNFAINEIPPSMIVKTQQEKKFGTDYSKADLYSKAKEYQKNTLDKFEDTKEESLIKEEPLIIEGPLTKINKTLGLLQNKKLNIEQKLNTPVRLYYQKLINDIGREPAKTYASPDAAILGALTKTTPSNTPTKEEKKDRRKSMIDIVRERESDDDSDDEDNSDWED